MIELERTYLAKRLPDGLKDCRSKEMLDIYLPKSARHPVIRLRKAGDKFELTKKEPVDDAKSISLEQTIKLTADEYEMFASSMEGKRVSKVRYYYKIGDATAEIDVFDEGMKGLVLVDVEFKDEAAKNSFSMPDFCLAEVTDAEFVAGGMLCGKAYSDIEGDLKKFNYAKIA